MRRITNVNDELITTYGYHVDQPFQEGCSEEEALHIMDVCLAEALCLPIMTRHQCAIEAERLATEGLATSVTNNFPPVGGLGSEEIESDDSDTDLDTPPVVAQSNRSRFKPMVSEPTELPKSIPE